MQELEAQLEAAAVDTEEHREHARVLEEHMENVRLEIKHAQASEQCAIGSVWLLEELQ